MSQSEPPTPPESADLKQRIKAVLAELEDESFKNEVLQELKEAAKKRKSSPLQHPAFLLILGFFLTGVVGTWLTSAWQSVRQEKERKQLAHEYALKQKYEVMDQINKAIAEAQTGAHVMVYVLTYGSGGKPSKALEERETYWNQARRSWLINSQVLKQKLAINFTNSEALELYQKIIAEGDDMAQRLNDLHERLKKSNWRDPKLTDVIDTRVNSIRTINEIERKTNLLLNHLKQEIQKEQVAQP
jgi:hypothetical protein